MGLIDQIDHLNFCQAPDCFLWLTMYNQQLIDGTGFLYNNHVNNDWQWKKTQKHNREWETENNRERRRKHREQTDRGHREGVGEGAIRAFVLVGQGFEDVGQVGAVCVVLMTREYIRQYRRWLCMCWVLRRTRSLWHHTATRSIPTGNTWKQKTRTSNTGSYSNGFDTYSENIVDFARVGERVAGRDVVRGGQAGAAAVEL